jgi:NAD(P)-dependent dehydrogenase (short-subunit alcohol dehydrogenase family)
MTALDGTVAVVTGASSGIGRATAVELARRGASVVLAARRADALEEVARECRQLGADALVVPADTADEAAVDALAQSAIDRFGRLDVWVNNAATSIYGRIEATDPVAVRRLFDVNVFGYLYGARAALRIFREQGSGTLIDVASMLGKVAGPWQGHYAMTKHAIVAMDESLRIELQDAPDIHVCTVMPAAIDTPFYVHGANYSGKQPKPPGPIYPPEAVATTIAGLAERPRREVYVGSVGGMTSALRRISPGLYEALYGRVLERDQFTDEPAPRTDGILFEPMAGERSEASGGWRERMPQRAVPPRRVAAAIAAVSALGVAGWVARGRSRSG